MNEVERVWLRCIACGFTKLKEPMITLEKYLMGRDLLYPTEFTEEIKKNAEDLLQKVNAFLTDLGVDLVEVSSGFRPAAINAATAGAAKKSAHQVCQAIDLKDDKYQTLANKIMSRLDLLEKHDLYLEDISSTKGKYTNWCHLQSRKTKSGKRVFLP